MYLLEKGFKGFFESYPSLCNGSYKAQAGHKLEPNRKRSWERSCSQICIQDEVITLKKKAASFCMPSF